MQKIKVIVSTKNLLNNQKQLLPNANFNIIESDFIETKVIDFDVKNINQILIFTSQNAVNSILDHPEIKTLKLKTTFCVGLKTKALLQENGFKVETYTSYAEDLSEIISLIYADETFTFFSGTLRRDTLPDALTENGIRFNEIQVYETVLTPKKIDIKPDGILFFSPSAVESYLKMNTIQNEICFCIGQTTAQTLENKKIKNIIITNTPSVENVIYEVLEYYNH